MSQSSLQVKEWQPVLDFWFGDEPDDMKCGRDKAELWWGKNQEMDRAIEQQFGHLLNGLVSGGYREWLSSPQGRLAAIIVIDQFSRNIHRGDAKAFVSDRLALQWCLDGIDNGDDLQLRPIERVFFYLPLEHSECEKMQEASLFNYKALIAAVPESQKTLFENYLGYAKQHADIIERFGRYPHRNEILGRESTPEELEFLQQPGSGF